MYDIYLWGKQKNITESSNKLSELERSYKMGAIIGGIIGCGLLAGLIHNLLKV